MKTRNFALVALFAAQATYAAPETKSFPAENVKELELRSMNGNVNVSGVDGVQASVTVDKGHFDKECSLKIDQSGSKIEVYVDKTKSSAKCEVNFDVKLPKAAAAEVKLGEGNVAMDDVHGKVEFKVGSGNVTVKGETPKLEGNVGNGNVVAEGVSNKVELETGNGDVTVNYASTSRSGDSELETGRGNISLSLPKDAKVKVKTKSGMGEKSNEFVETNSPTFKVEVKAGMGNIAIKKLP